MQVSGEVSRPRARELAILLFKTEGNNKLSTDFNPAPFTMVQTTGTKVTLRNLVGVQLNRNTAFVKKCNEHNDVANGNGHHMEQESSMVQAEEPEQSRISETTEVSGTSWNPVTTGVSERFQVQAGHCTEREDNGVRRLVRRSTRTIRQLLNF